MADDGFSPNNPYRNMQTVVGTVMAAKWEAENSSDDPAAILRDPVDLDAAAEHAAEPMSSDLLAPIRCAEAWLATQ